MIWELINQSSGTRRLERGVDVLEQVKSCREIKGSNSSIFEVELKQWDTFIETPRDTEFFNEQTYHFEQQQKYFKKQKKSNNKRGGSTSPTKEQTQQQYQLPSSSVNIALPANISSNNNISKPPPQPNETQKYILKEIIGSNLRDELNLVTKIRSREVRLLGLVYLINYAVYKTDTLEVAYILMERGDMNLQEFVEWRRCENRPLTKYEFQSISRQTIAALAELQREKIAHNDIKPANILVFLRYTNKGAAPAPATQNTTNTAMITNDHYTSSPATTRKNISSTFLQPNNLTSASQYNTQNTMSPKRKSPMRKQNLSNVSTPTPSNAIDSTTSTDKTHQRVFSSFYDSDSPVTANGSPYNIRINNTTSNNNINSSIHFANINSNLPLPGSANGQATNSSQSPYEIIVKLCDIGSGQSDQSTEKFAEQRGTLSYMAPEIVLNRSNERVNIYKQDVFSLGLCLVYVMLQKTNNYYRADKAPWKNLVPLAESKLIFRDVLADWARIIGNKLEQSSQVSSLLTKMLCFDVKNRPDCIQLMKIYAEIFEGASPVMMPAIADQLETSSVQTSPVLKPNSITETNSILQSQNMSEDQYKAMLLTGQIGLSLNDESQQQQFGKNRGDFQIDKQASTNMKQTNKQTITLNNQPHSTQSTVASTAGVAARRKYIKASDFSQLGELAESLVFNINDTTKSVQQKPSIPNQVGRTIPAQMTETITTNAATNTQSSANATSQILRQNSIQQSMLQQSKNPRYVSVQKTPKSNQFKKRLPSSVPTTTSIPTSIDVTSSSSIQDNLEGIPRVATNKIKGQSQIDLEFQMRKTLNSGNQMSLIKNVFSFNGSTTAASSQLGSINPMQLINNNNSILNNIFNKQPVSAQTMQMSLIDKKSMVIYSGTEKKIPAATAQPIQPQVAIISSIVDSPSKNARQTKKEVISQPLIKFPSLNGGNNSMNSNMLKQSQMRANFNSSKGISAFTSPLGSSGLIMNQNGSNTTISSMNSLPSKGEIVPTPNQQNTKNEETGNPPTQVQGMINQSSKASIFSKQKQQNVRGINNNQSVMLSNSSVNNNINNSSSVNQGTSNNLNQRQQQNGAGQPTNAAQFKIHLTQAHRSMPQALLNSSISSARNQTNSIAQTQQQHLLQSQSLQGYHSIPQGNASNSNGNYLSAILNNHSSTPNNNNNNNSNNNNLNVSSSNFQFGAVSAERSSKSLMESLSESVERVVVSEYAEMQKFYENFSKISAKHTKYLAVNLIGATTNPTKIYGLLELLSRCEGLMFLSLYVAQQSKTVVDCISSIINKLTPNLEVLSMTFRECDFSNPPINPVSGGGSNNGSADFEELARLKDQGLTPIPIVASNSATAAPQKQTKTQLQQIILQNKRMSLFVAFEGKCPSSSDIVGSLFEKWQERLLRRVDTFEIDLRRQTQVDLLPVLTKLGSHLKDMVRLNSFAIDLSCNPITSNHFSTLFNSIDQLQNIQTFALNVQGNTTPFDRSFAVSFPAGLKCLYLNFTNDFMTSMEFVKLTKAIKSLIQLDSIHLHLSTCVKQTESSQFMLFLFEILRHVRKVSIVADSNHISDSDFNIYKSNLLEEFKVEELTLSLAKNNLTIDSFKILAEMIFAQKTLVKVDLSFPRTILNKQIKEIFQGAQNENTYKVSLRNDDYDVFLMSINISPKQTGRQSLSILTEKLRQDSKEICVNIENRDILQPGYWCLTCFNQYSSTQNDGHICKSCLNTCHLGHDIIHLGSTLGMQFVCKCKELRCGECEADNHPSHSCSSLSPMRTNGAGFGSTGGGGSSSGFNGDNYKG